MFGIHSDMKYEWHAEDQIERSWYLGYSLLKLPTFRLIPIPADLKEALRGSCG
jgi:hypothetical protein